MVIGIVESCRAAFCATTHKRPVHLSFMSAHVQNGIFRVNSALTVLEFSNFVINLKIEFSFLKYHGTVIIPKRHPLSNKDQFTSTVYGKKWSNLCQGAV